MLREGRLPLLRAEHEAVEKLADENDGASLSLTRRDPGETGPLLVHLGDTTWEISEDGKRKKVS